MAEGYNLDTWPYKSEMSWLIVSKLKLKERL